MPVKSKKRLKNWTILNYWNWRQNSPKAVKQLFKDINLPLHRLFHRFGKVKFWKLLLDQVRDGAALDNIVQAGTVFDEQLYSVSKVFWSWSCLDCQVQRGLQISNNCDCCSCMCYWSVSILPVCWGGPLHWRLVWYPVWLPKSSQSHSPLRFLQPNEPPSDRLDFGECRLFSWTPQNRLPILGFPAKILQHKDKKHSSLWETLNRRNEIFYKCRNRTKTETWK